MNTTQITAASAVHDLGVATSLGGAVFGRVALHPAVEAISDRQERGEVIHKAWKRFNVLNLISHVAFAGSWIADRQRFTKFRSAETKSLVLAKDILVGASVVTGVVTIATGQYGIRMPESGAVPPMDERGGVTPEVPRRTKIAETVTGIFGILNMVALAGVVGVTAALMLQER